MKQPQLGKKIAELRLAKGLTQTELAEKCQISLRTIQRIESTEVTPRSYTVKLIFKALDFDAYTSTNSNSADSSNESKNSRNIMIIAFLLILITSTVSILIFKFLTTEDKQPRNRVAEIIHTNQSNIQRWINNKQIDSVLTMYSEDACILNTVCGKEQIGQKMKEILDSEYKIAEYNTIAITISNSVAVEKYEMTYKHKAIEFEEVGIIEWQHIDKKWLITNNLYRNKTSSIIRLLNKEKKDGNSLIILE